MSETAFLTGQTAGKKFEDRTCAGLQFLPEASLPQGDLGKLTPRQLDTLRLLADGYYYKEIGTALGISHATVRAHLHAVYRKLNVKSRARAVIVFHDQSRLMPAGDAGDIRAGNNYRRV